MATPSGNIADGAHRSAAESHSAVTVDMAALGGLTIGASATTRLSAARYSGNSTQLRPPPIKAAMSSRSRPRASSSKSWRVTLIRSRGHVLGEVEAPNRQAAEAAAVKQFGLSPEDRNRIVIQERG
jgi:hypothetical protein